MAVKKKAGSKPKVVDDDAWVKRHFEWLVDNHAGKYLVVSEGEPFIGYDAAELERKARKKHPGVITTGMPIPRPEDFLSIL
jgi:hypothetical protein